MPEEATPFLKVRGSDASVFTVVTGVGHNNARKAIARALDAHRPDLVLTCGFAGGLRPGLQTGDVLFSTDDEELATRLATVGAVRARFHCSPRIASTAREKISLFKETGADAVEMESEIICCECRDRKVRSAVVRVILDRAEDDLPLDFNRLMKPDQSMHYGKLALAVLQSPQKIPALLKLQRQTRAAGQKLAEVLLKISAEPDHY
jgi:adenosylhomocysteine nucleosidase